MNGFSLPQRSSCAAATDTPTQPPLLRLSSSIRRHILVLAGLPQHEVFYLDSPWRDDRHLRGDHGRTTKKTFHAAIETIKAQRPSLDLTISLFLTCKTVSTEANALFYSSNTFITKDPEPLTKLNPQSLASLTDLHILLTSVRGDSSDYLCKHFYPWEGNVMTTRPEIRQSTLETWQKLAPFLGRTINQDHQLNLSLRSELSHYGPTEEDLYAAENILAGLAYFPPLASCRISLGNGRHSHMKILRQMAREAARKATFQEEFKRRPFRYLDLPADIRFRVLEYTDLIAPEEVLGWSRDSGYSMRFGYNIWRCRQIRFGRATKVRDCCCQVIGGYTPWCFCWIHPTPLFLVNKTFLAEARHVFYRNHHIYMRNPLRGVQNDPCAFAGYAGIDFAGTALEPSLWGMLKSLQIELHHLTDDDRDASSRADWWRIVETARAAASLNLHYLQLSIRSLRTLTPTIREMVKLEPEPRIDAIRRFVDGWYWPLDAGERSSLPFGTRHFEIHICPEGPGIAMYRIQQLKQRPLSQAVQELETPEDGYMHRKSAVASRVLLGGDMARHCRPEPDDKQSHTSADWIEDVWFRI